MFTIGECLNFWSINELVKADKANIEEACVREDAIEFLTKIGLPRKDGNLRFSQLETPLIAIENYVISDYTGRRTIPLDLHSGTFYVIGDMGPITEEFGWIASVICINPREGEVVTFGRGGDKGFINSSVMLLFQFLTVMKAEW